ncbi:PTS ascorbate transporter subunit IIC [Fictibacillus sp. KIGAM418]|uniref:PTS ascorbate transporter subunit IIC n=1 Tax=Fictibacillus marinisediminis TaxID=2878389 RepID=A0A9X2BG32_9BACL|nr:PTS ascorbate transporter subunit IIC [Fictibacillus marinisediminis]MCK6259390.1 PTS ascorbate transporter subunit IIC [Fictibacillus marinisediminis]
MNLSGVWDWTFFWNSFGFILKTVASFLMIIVAIIAVGLLLSVVIKAVKNSRE